MSESHLMISDLLPTWQQITGILEMTGFVRVLEIIESAWISMLCFQGLKRALILV